MITTLNVEIEIANVASKRLYLRLYNFISYGTSVETTSTTYGSNYLSLISERQQHQQQSFNDSYTALILEESEKLYNKLITKLTDSAMGAAAAITVSLPLSGNNNNQKLTYKNDRYERGAKI
jgi:hypothetical protein